ncbi:hypothetical protein [Halovalidus salilacus]
MGTDERLSGELTTRFPFPVASRPTAVPHSGEAVGGWTDRERH